MRAKWAYSLLLAQCLVHRNCLINESCYKNLQDKHSNFYGSLWSSSAQLSDLIWKPTPFPDASARPVLRQLSSWFLFFRLLGLQDFSFPARDWTQATEVKAWSPNLWTPGNSHHCLSCWHHAFPSSLTVSRSVWTVLRSLRSEPSLLHSLQIFAYGAATTYNFY